MSTDTRHPSALELDVRFAAGTTDRAVDDHLHDCAGCRRYWDALVAADAVPARLPHAPARAPGSLRRRMVAVAAAGALVGAVALVVARGPRPDGYVGVKGAPAVQVLVRAGARTAIWDGRSPLRPGDALALRVACEGFAQVAVLTPAAEGKPARAFAGACPADARPLPFSLVVDDAPGAEAVTTVFSAQPLDDDALAGAVTGASRNKLVWVVSLSFPKTGGGR